MRTRPPRSSAAATRLVHRSLARRSPPPRRALYGTAWSPCRFRCFGRASQLQTSGLGPKFRLGRRNPVVWLSRQRVFAPTKTMVARWVAGLTLSQQVLRECAVFPADDGQTERAGPCRPARRLACPSSPSRCGSTRDRRRRRRSPSRRCPRATSRRPAPTTSRAGALAAMRHRRSAPSSHSPTATGHWR